MKVDDGDRMSHALSQSLERARERLGPFTSLRYYRTIGSTNDAAAGLPEGHVVFADEQTAGRGRRGHTWFSPSGSGIYASVVVAPAKSSGDPARATLLVTIAAGVALAEGIAGATGLQPDLKWPNDLYVARRKLAGILAESAADRVILGFGINTGSSAFPPDLSDRVTSLETELGRPVDRDAVFVEALAAMSRRYDDLLRGRFDAILDAWRSRAPGSTGALVERMADGAVQRGITAGIDDRGALLLRTGDRIERIVSGELTWL